MKQKTIVIASSNQHKLKEFKKMFAENEATKDIAFLTMKDVGFDGDIIEDGKTFEENALIKARAVNKFLRDNKLEYLVLADDSGLCVDALDGAPGVYSARFAEEHNDFANREKLKAELLGKQNRTAKFVTNLVLMNYDGTYLLAVGETNGKILENEVGSLEFCYDPLFYSFDLNKSFGEATEEEKNSVSHRGRAVQKLLKQLVY